MPFSKWNLEPVYVSRAPPWSHLQHYHHHHHQQHQVLKSTTTNNNVINDSSLTTATTTNVQQTSTTTTTTTTNSETISLPPFVLKLSSIEDDTNRRDENRSTDDVDDEGGGGRSDDIDSIEETTTNDDDTQRELSTKCESILLKIECRTMVGIVRQMAALLGAADQQFAEIVDECRKLTERSTLLRSRVVKLSGNVDRANLAIRQSPPQITSLLELLPDPTMNLKLTSSSNHNQRYINNNHHHCTLDISGRFGIPIFDHSSSSPTTAASKWWHSNTTLETNLFAPETRPLSVRALYGRAHSPGDLRLSSNSFAIGNHSGVNCSTIGHYGYPSPFVTMLKFRRQQQQQQQLMLNNHAQSNLSQNRQQSMDQCRCDCGRCHRQSITSTTTNNNNINMNNSHNVNHNRNSSPSSLVTWSSVASSSAFESNPIVVKHHQNGTSMAKTMEQSAIVKSTITTKPVTNTSRRSTLLSSFSSADYDVEDYDQQITLPATTNTKIDDFFRANNVPINRNEMSDSIRIQCRCSCSIDQSSVTDIYSQIDSQIDQFTNVTNMTTTTTMTTTTNATTTNADQKRLESSTMNKSDCSNYWNWWLSDDEHRRWSSALTSPLKPATMIDEMSVWLRENIETRRPESVVFKSASDVPNHILLERALSPPCSSHSIQLRPKKLADSEQISINGDESKLRRRWSLFPIRRKSRQQHQSSSSGSVPPPLKSIKNNESSPSSSSTLQSNQFFNRFSRTRRSLPSSTTIRRNHLESNQTEHDDPQTTLPIDEEDNGPREVLLMSPEERFKLLAGQYSQSTIVNIDISGRNFNRLSMGRRSLIHTDFHIPRHRIGGIAGNNGSQQQQQRSRSKSPIKQHYKESNISPYALSGRLPEIKPNPIVVVAERGCQTENDDKLIRVDVHHNPSSNDNLRKNNDDDNDDDDDYVMLLRKMSTNVPVRSKQQQQQHSSNESTTNGSNGLPDSQTTTTTTTTNIKQQQMRLNHDSQQTITLRYRGNELSAAAAKSRRQNGGRSSSGNWSAATSDLLQSSSTSSSPLQSDQQQQQQQQQKHQLNKIQRKRYQPTATKFANGKSLVAHQAVMATVSSVELTVGGIGQNNSGMENGSAEAAAAAAAASASNSNEEAESVYSVDNDGYYTSMHTDSGLFFGHDIPPIEINQNNRLKHSSRVTNARPFERIQEEPSNLLEMNQMNDCGSNLSINSILSNSDATSIAIDQHQQQHKNNETNDTITHDFDCSVSHCSHQFINNDQRSTNNNRTIVSNGHRTLPDVEEKRRMTAAAMRRMIQQQQQQQQQNKIKPGTRIRSVSGTFDDDDDDQTTMVRESSESSSDTIQLINQNQGIKRSASYRIPISSSSNYQQQQQTIGQQNYDIRRSKTMQFPPTHIKRNGMDQSIGRCKLLSSSSSNNRSNNRQCSSVALTESSSASSSCRKLPPPPPPPRVSSMLSTLKQYRNDHKQQQQQQQQQNHHRRRRTIRPKIGTKAINRSDDFDDEEEEGVDDDDYDDYIDDDDDDEQSSMISESDRRLSVASGATDSIVSSSLHTYRYQMNGSNHNQQQLINHYSESETNSEYLHHGNERRRRLFLLDSNRSYPPLYVPPISTYDGTHSTDTATTISGGSELFDDEDGDGGGDNDSKIGEHEDDDVNYDSRIRKIDDDRSMETIATKESETSTLCSGGGGGNSVTPTADNSSRTITPTFDTNTIDRKDKVEDEIDEERKVVVVAAAAAAVVEEESRSQFGTLERKQLEERHLSSPLPPPKLASFVRMGENQRMNECERQRKCSTTSSTTSSSTSPPKSPPKPKPRNSLHFAQTPPCLQSFSKETDSPITIETSSTTTSSSSTSSTSSPACSPTTTMSTTTITTTTTSNNCETFNQPQSPNGNTKTNILTSPNRRLTTEDLFIILHNSKKRHNIRTEPEIFTSNRMASPQSPQSPNGSERSNQSPKLQSPQQQQQQQQDQMKRRSWTGIGNPLSSPNRTLRNNHQQQPQQGSATNPGLGQPRTRQSLALDRLGPLRPTTLTDFKRLLAQVRPPSSSSSSTTTLSSTLSPNKHNQQINSTINNQSNTTPAVSSTYTALQQLLKGTTSTSTSMSQNSNLKTTMTNSHSTSSGFSSIGSPEIVSPLSPARVSSLGTISSPSGSPSSRSRFSPSPIVSPMSPISNRQTMNLFVKKFGKSTTTSNGRYESSNYAGLNHVNVSCPPIPEVPDCPTGENGSESVPTNNSSTSSSSSANNMKHNCTSTWV